MKERPSRVEIREQLARMLAGPRFGNAANQGTLLAFVVESALEQRSISEDVIGYALFPNYNAEFSTDVRATASTVRARLKEYYATEGSRDKVVIQLPAGRRYLPTFSYNSKAKSVTEYLLGMEAVGKLSNFPDEDRIAYRYFRDALKEDPNYAPALAAIAQVELLMSCYMQVPEGLFKKMDYDGISFFSRASSHAIRALEADMNLWRAHAAVAAATCCSQGKCDMSLFNEALALSEGEARRDPWYLVCLVGCGRIQEALSIAKEIAEEKNRPLIRDSFGYALYAVISYVNRNYYSANLLAIYAMTETPFSYLPWFIMGCCALADTGRTKYQARMIDNMAQACSPQSELLNGFMTNPPFDGLRALFYAGAEWQSQAERVLKDLSEGKNVLRSSWDLALAFLAVGKMDEAVKELEQCYRDCHPFILWLDVWPFLDPLREHPAFLRLSERRRIGKLT